MKNVNIFCFLGKSGAGKSAYFNRFIEDSNFMNIFNIEQLIYGTTRKKREKEIDGVDYHFYSYKEYCELDYNDVLESRKYKTVNGIKYYFTLKKDILNTDNVICIASPYQYESYKNWCKKHSDDKIKYNIYPIIIYTELKTRISRLINRADNDNDIYELCRRILDERVEFDEVSEFNSEINIYSETSKIIDLLDGKIDKIIKEL